MQRLHYFLAFFFARIFPVSGGCYNKTTSSVSNPALRLNEARVTKDPSPRLPGEHSVKSFWKDIDLTLPSGYYLRLPGDDPTHKSYQDHSTLRLPRDTSSRRKALQANPVSTLPGSHSIQKSYQYQATLRLPRAVGSRANAPQSRLGFSIRTPQSTQASSTENKYTDSLDRLYRELIVQHLNDCNLIIVAGKEFQKSRTVQTLVRYPNPKQVAFIDSPEELAHQITWKTTKCQGTLLIMSDTKALVDFGKASPFLWDYSARVIIAELSQDSLEEFLMTSKGWKTEHVIGIVKGDQPGGFRLLINPLLSRGRMKEVATWRGARSFKTNLDIFPDKSTNLQGIPLNVIVFEWHPAIIYHRDKDGGLLARYGRDVAIVETLAEVFNFSIVYREPPLDELWGNRLPNGSFNGMVGLLGSGEGDLGIANLFLTIVGGRDLFQEYSRSFADDQGCYLTRVDPPLPRWHSPVLPFQLTTWITLLVGLILSGPVLYFVSLISSLISEEKNPISFSRAIFDTYGIHINFPMTKPPERSSVRTFVLFLLIYSLLITTGYKANLTAFFTVTRQPRSIETSKDLYESGLRVLGLAYDKPVLEYAENQYLRALSERFDVRPNVDAMKPDVLAGKAVAISNKRFLELTTAQMVTSRGKPLVRIMQECFSSNPVGIGYQKHSPLKAKFDKMITRMVESGIITKWYLDSIDRYKRQTADETQDLGNKPKEEEEEQQQQQGGATPLGMDHLQGIFFLLAFGCVVSTVIFSVEVARGYKDLN